MAADSFTFEGQHINNAGAAAQQQYVLGVKKEFSGFAGDLAFSYAQTEGTNALSTRLEAGITGSMPVGPVDVYTRVALGQKYTNTGSFGYYSVEPGVAYTFGKATAKLGYRYRDSFKESNEDQSDTVRVGLSYALTKHDTIGVRYDRARGDSNNHSYNLSYTRGF
jgi:hypothetical protein